MNVAADVCLCVCMRGVAGGEAIAMAVEALASPPRHLSRCEEGAREAGGAVLLTLSHLSGSEVGAGEVLQAGLGGLPHLLPLPRFALLLPGREPRRLEKLFHLRLLQRLSTLGHHEHPKGRLQGGEGVAVQGGLGGGCGIRGSCHSLGCDYIGSWGSNDWGLGSCGLGSRGL